MSETGASCIERETAHTRHDCDRYIDHSIVPMSPTMLNTVNTSTWPASMLHQDSADTSYDATI